MDNNVFIEFENLRFELCGLLGCGSDRILNLRAYNSAKEELGIKITKIGGFTAGGMGIIEIPAGVQGADVTVFLPLYGNLADGDSVDLEIAFYRKEENKDYDRQLQKHKDEEDYPMPQKRIFLPAETGKATLKL